MGHAVNGLKGMMLGVLALASIGAGAGTLTTETRVMGPFAGHDAALHPANLAPHRLAFYGTDLGWTYAHDGRIHILFGDTWATHTTPYIEESTGRRYDDAFGTLEINPEWIDADHVPLIRYGQNPGSTEMSAIDPGHAMEGFKTPVGGFSNGVREFGVFYVSKPKACADDAGCTHGLTCDTGLGYLGTPPRDDAGHTLACVDGSEDCTDDPALDYGGQPIADSGLCVNETSSNRAPTDVGRISGMGLRHLVGLRDIDVPKKYTVISEWLTQKFINPSFRTVKAFDPGRPPTAAGQDYHWIDGPTPGGKVFIWGRPNFVGVGATGRDLGLYFAMAGPPRSPDFTWDVQFFTGLDDRGLPLFSRDEKEARALDLDASEPGHQPREIHDVVDQHSVAWVEPLGRWVMLYGGGMVDEPSPSMPECGLVQFFARDECGQVEIGNGAVRMRTAKHPWGPWTPPQDVLVGGDPDTVPPEQQYAEGGILFHPACEGERCTTRTGSREDDDYGWLYAANIIEQWTRPVGDGVEIFWNVSTSNPYRVVLMSTVIWHGDG